MNRILSPRDILGEMRCVITDGHFVGPDYKHSSSFVDPPAAYSRTWHMDKLCESLSDYFDGDKVNAVVSLSPQGANLARSTAHFLNKGRRQRIATAYCDSDSIQAPIIKPLAGELVTGMKVLLVEGVLVQCGLVEKAVAGLQALGCRVIGLGAFCKRADVMCNVPKLISLVRLHHESWSADACPLCAQNVPVDTEVGLGREFLASRHNQDE